MMLLMAPQAQPVRLSSSQYQMSYLCLLECYIALTLGKLHSDGDVPACSVTQHGWVPSRVPLCWQDTDQHFADSQQAVLRMQNGRRCLALFCSARLEGLPNCISSLAGRLDKRIDKLHKHLRPYASSAMASLALTSPHLTLSISRQ